MESERAEGIVLRKHPVTETSLIVTWYTRERGKLKTMAKGARRSKGPFLGKIDLFYHDEILFLPSRRSDLHLLTDCFVVKAHTPLRTTVELLTAASYACELVEVITPMEDPQPALFDLLASALEAIEKGSDWRVLLIWLEIRLLTAAGWQPQWSPTTASGRLLRSLGESTLAVAQRIRLRDAQVIEARRSVWGFWDAEVGRVPRSRAMLMQRQFRITNSSS